MKKGNYTIDNRSRRRARIRAKISGTSAMPRLSIFRSNKHLYGQLVDDVKGATLAASSDMKEKGKTKTERARAAGKALAEAAVAKKITKAVFDRGGFAYTGRVKAFADGAREGGLAF